MAARAGPPQLPKPAMSKGYRYGFGGFTVNDIPRAEPARLKQLLLSKPLKGVRAERAAREDRERTIKKKWVIAQLKHYGVKVDAKANEYEVQALLVKNVSEGHIAKCDRVPQSVLDIKDSLRRRFEPIEHEYKTKKAAYDNAESVRVNQEFAALDSPSAEANYSIPMFMTKYFLDEHGKPDKSKTPDPLPLPGFIQRSQMHAAAEAIPGLETQSGGGSHSNDRVIVVGWNRSAVWRVAGSIISQGAVRRAAEAKAELEGLMKRHEDFAKGSSANGRNATFSISAILGLYLVECDDMGEPNNMRLKVVEGREGLVGIFDFDVLEGIMLLGQSREEVAIRWRGMETGESEIQLDPGNEHQGHLDFLDDLGMRFVGTANFGFVGKNVQFKKYKIGSVGGPVTRSWNDYSEAEYEKARTGRWG